MFVDSANSQENAGTTISPNRIVDAAANDEWVKISAEDLLLIRLSKDKDGNSRNVVIQLIPAPFSQGWVHNIRVLARANWYDGVTINRVQDNYVVQWGDLNHDNPEAAGKAKPLPDGLKVMKGRDFIVETVNFADPAGSPEAEENGWSSILQNDSHSQRTTFKDGWPVAIDEDIGAWPIHCYGMVGVGHSDPPDTGSGAELYAVIGHAPRHIDRNVALVGRIVSGMEHLSSLPRGSGALGFYTDKEHNKRVQIRSVHVVSDLREAEQPKISFLNPNSASFVQYAKARAKRPESFFIHKTDRTDICNIPIPVRKADSR